jgi:hypothetical protein
MPGKGEPDTLMDEFYVFGRALELPEIRALYARRDRTGTARVAVPAAAPPVVDGVLADGEYTTAAGLTGFQNRVTGLLDDEQGRAFLSSDAEALTIAFSWPVPEKVRMHPDNYSFGPVRKEGRTRDADLSEDDCVGLVVRTGAGGTQRILANALGTIRDEMEGDPGWDSGARAACTLDQDAWICELRVPLASLNLADDRTCRLRLVRTHRLLRRDDVAWPGTDAEEWATATVGSDAAPVQLLSLGSPQSGALDVVVRNPGSTAATVHIRLDSGEVDEAVPVAPGATQTVRRTLTDTSLNQLYVSASRDGSTVYEHTVATCYPPVLDADVFHYPGLSLAEVHLTTRGAASAAPAAVSLLRPPSEEPLRQQTVAGGADRRVIPLDTTGLTPGSYVIRSRVGEEGTVLGLVSRTLVLQAPPAWLGNRLGIVDNVPAPWTPLVRTGNALSCWGRTVDFGDSVLPAALVSQDRDILAAPVRLTATVNGSEVTLSETPIRYTLEDDQRVEWEAEPSLGEAQCTIRASMEFDGLLWYQLSLTGAPDVVVQHLALDIPLRAEHSDLLYSGDYRTRDTGRTPEDAWHCGFRPCLGLSDEVRGLQWFAESMQGWHLNDSDRALQILPAGDRRTLRVTFIDTPTPLEKERTIRFGLQPTPVKPPLQGRRMVRPRIKGVAEPPQNIALWWTDYSLGCSVPIPVSDNAAERLRQQQQAGIRVHAYTRLCECSVKAPQYAAFGDEWRLHPGPRKSFNPEADWGTANPVCPGSESWRDWTVWSFYQACRELDFDGIYYDVSRPPFCANRQHGCGYEDDSGSRQPEYQLLATRELQKRMWIMMHTEFEGKWISHHMSGELTLMCQSFDDLIIDGENFTSMLKDTYYELLPLDKFRAEFMGHQWGVPSVFLPEFSRAQLTPEAKNLWNSPAKIPAVRHLAGMIALHDSLVWPAYSDPTPYVTIWQAQDAIGWSDEVTFIPYWATKPPYRSDHTNVVASVFQNGQRTLAVAFNNTDEQARLVLLPDTLPSPAPPAGFRDFETGKTLEATGRDVPVLLPPRNFRLLIAVPQ